MVVVYVVELIIPSHPHYEMTAECLRKTARFSLVRFMLITNRDQLVVSVSECVFLGVGIAPCIGAGIEVYACDCLVNVCQSSFGGRHRSTSVLCIHE